MIHSEFFWRPVVIGGSLAIRNSLLEVLRRRMPVPEHRVQAECKRVEGILELVQSADANVCFIGVSEDQERVLSAIRELAARNLTVVAFHDTDESGLILKCIRSGVQEFLSGPFEYEAIWAVLDNLAARRLKSGEEMRGLVYVVLPAKPNYGATTVATNLAYRAQREGYKSVLLADLDPLYGNVAFQLKLPPGYSFIDAFSNWKRIDQDFWRQLVVARSGVDILMSPEAATRVSFEWPSAGEFLNFVRERYSVAFLDCPGLSSDWYTQLASQADGVFLVINNELTAVHAAKRSLERLETGCEAGKLRLISNRYQPENGVATNALEAALERTVFHTLPNDVRAVQNAIVEGKLVASDSKLGKSLDELWARVARKPASANRRSRGLISSLLGRRRILDPVT